MQDEGKATTRPLGQSFIIKRPRLTKLLDESEARIILLVAPAGYGKTTLAREWLSAWRGPVAWFSSSSASADVAAFSSGIAAELDHSLSDAAKTSTERLAALASIEQRPDPLARVLSKSRPDWPSGLVLAIDDYHHLANSANVEEFVGTLIQLLPATFVITSRSRPNWVTPRSAIYGETFELGASELAMRDDEARDVLQRSTCRHSKNSIELAQGWPAIIGLAAHTETDDLPNVLPSRLYEFLAADLVGAAPRDVQDALALLALAGVSDRSTALKVIGPTAGSAINEAERRGLLTFGDRDQLTLHPLLSDFLIVRLRREPAKLAALVTRLAPTLIASQEWDECLAVAEAVPEYPFPVAHVLEESLDELLSDGRVATVSRWTQLARTAGLDAPVIALAEAEVALRAGDHERALALGSRAARAIAPPELIIRAQLLTARAAHLSNNRATARDWFLAAEEASSSTDMRVAAIWGQFTVQFEDESGDLSGTLARFVAATDGSIEHELRCAQGRVLLAVAESNVVDAVASSFRGVALLSLPADALTRLAALNLHAWILVWAGRYREAISVSDRGLAEAEAACIDFAVTHIQMTKATALIGLRQFSSAQQLISTLRRQVQEEVDHWAGANLQLAEAKLQISLGDLERAANCLRLPLRGGQSASQRSEYFGYRGLIAAAQDFTEEAEAFARRSQEGSTHVEATAFPAVTRAINAARTAVGSKTVLEHFESALASGLNDSIVTACRACPELVVQIASTPHRETLAAILTESNDVALAGSAGLRLPKSARHAAGLSPREIEVYELIIQGRTNREIAKLLFIAESTTKVHVRHILGKLGVRSRVDAVRAWQLDNG